MINLPEKYRFHDSFKDIESISCPLIFGLTENIPNPFFSVVIPTYGRPEYLVQAISSILKQEDFDLPFEIVVVDNEASTDPNGTEKLLRELNLPNLLYYRNSENIGGAGNWNRCIAKARSQWVIMCHDDDMLKPSCLRIMAQIVEKHKKDKLPLGYVRSSAEPLYEGNIQRAVFTGSHNRMKKKEDAVVKMDFVNVILTGGATWSGAPTCGTLINKQAIMAVGGYNKELTPCFDCYVPFSMIGKYGVFKTYYSLGIYRWGQNDTYRKSTILNLIRAYNEFLEILSKEYLFVKLFSNEHYADCVNYYSKKAEEGKVVLSSDEIGDIRPLCFSKTKLNLILQLRKAFSFWSQLIAK